MAGFAGNLNGLDEGILCGGPELDIMAISSAYLTKGGNVGTHNTAAMQHCLNHRQTKAFDAGRCEKKFAMPIAPLQLCFGDAVKKKHTLRKSYSLDEAVNARGLRSFNANDDEPAHGIDVSAS